MEVTLRKPEQFSCTPRKAQIRQYDSSGQMAAKAALVLLLASAAAYRCQRVVPHRSDARTSAAVIAAERRRRFGAVAALSGIAAAPSTARAITWKVRDRRPLHSTSRGDGVEVFDSKRSILDYIYVSVDADGRHPTQDDREDVNAVFMDKYPKAILIESGIALVILALAKAGIGPLGEKFREEGD